MLIIDSIDTSDRSVRLAVEKRNETCKIITLNDVYGDHDIILNEEELAELKEYL
jgi:hypothetical protein